MPPAPQLMSYDPAALARLGESPLPPGGKGLPARADGMALGAVGEQGWALDDLTLPAMILRESVVEDNIAALARFCAGHGVWLAPHGKTSMAPQLIARQIEAGCWAMTAATDAHLRVYRAFGCSRILVANQLVDPATVRWLVDELTRDDGFEVYVFVDSPDGVALLDSALAACDAPRPLLALLELGFAGGRAGCRDLHSALATAEAAQRAAHLRLVGVSGFEGIIDAGDVAATMAEVSRFVARVPETAGALEQRGLFEAETVLLTAGGSAYFDAVLAVLSEARLASPTQVVLRSGCYLSQDAGFYDATSPLAGRAVGARTLRNAIEVWARVLSRPEPGWAVAGAGKRDLPIDLGLPRLLDGVGDLPSGARTTVRKLSDQHAHLEIDPGLALAVGDRVAFGISHPCTAFDKWRVIASIDDDGRLAEAIATYF